MNESRSIDYVIAGAGIELINIARVGSTRSYVLEGVFELQGGIKGYDIAFVERDYAIGRGAIC